jgi:N-acyl-D-aspartate/D-glutamate deacylase
MAEYDLIIRNGTIVDGTGGIPAYRGDVAIKQGKIAMISGRIKATAIKRSTLRDASWHPERLTCTTITICS